MQQDNDLKHNSKSTEWLKKKTIKVLQWPSQSPDLNAEMLMRAVLPANLNEPKPCCKEEWVKILPQRRERLINNSENNYFKLLLLLYCYFIVILS